MVRLFVGVDLPPQWKDALSKAAAGAVKCGGRPTARNNLHLTVHFIGDIPEDQVPALASALVQAASALPAFALAFVDLRAKADRMLWAAFEDCPAWKDLCETIALAAFPFCGQLPERAQTAHATLARFPRGGARRCPVPAFAPPGPVLAVDHADLIRSRLGPAGPQYAPEQRLELARRPA